MKKLDEDLKKIIDKYQVSAKKNFGQNFLLDLDILNIIKGFIEEDNHLNVIEVGCGIGTLTRYLVNKYKIVEGYEIENDMINILESEYKFNNLNLHKEDILKADLSYLDKSYLVIGNIPYNITSKVIKKILKLNKPISFAFMVQKEVAEKFYYVQGGTKNNALGTYLALNGNYKVVANVLNTSFVPSPKIDSAFISYNANSANIDDLKILESLYFNTHKTLRNNFKKINENVSKMVGEQIDLSKRIHQLTLEEIKTIIKLFNN